MSHKIKLFTRWRVEGNLPEVAAILSDTASYADWWPEAWVQSELVDPGQSAGLKRIATLTPRKGLPGGGSLSARLVLDERPQSWATQFSGFVEGRGVWSLHQDGPMADIGHDWNVALRHPVLRWFGPLGRGLARFRLRGIMKSGETALAREVMRRRSHRMT